MSLDFLLDERPGALLVDLSQVALATAMQTYEPGMKFTIKDVRTLIMSSLKQNAFRFKSEGFNKIVIAIDNAKNGYWRRQFRDYYKRNRAIAREEAADSFDWEGYFAGLHQVIQEMKDFMPWIVVDVKFAEADDCIGVLTKHFVNNGYKVRIVSSDGDFTQLHKYEYVDQWSPMQKKFVKVKSDSPEIDCMTKILKGDRKDCVAAIKVRGDFWLTYDSETERTPPTSAAMLKLMVGKTDDEVYDILYSEALKKTSHKKSGPDETLKLLKLLGIGEIFEQFEFSPDKAAKYIADAQIIRFKENRVLIDFDYIREDIVANILEHYENYTPAGRNKMYSYFVKSGLSTLMKDINLF